jgi:hypothetical protein
LERPDSILLYHDVRGSELSRIPGIKGLTIQQFKGQIEYMQKYYTFVTAPELLEALEHGARLPQTAVMPTFDDGYIDHFTNVFPILGQKGIQGCFLPIGKAVAEHRVTDVIKLHFALASISDNGKFVREIFSILDEFRADYRLENNEHYYRAFTSAVANRYDPPEVIFTKFCFRRSSLSHRKRRLLTDSFGNMSLMTRKRLPERYI